MIRTIHKMILPAVLLASWWMGCAAAETVPVIPLLPEKPVIDGVMGKNEWRRAMVIPDSEFAEQDKDAGKAPAGEDTTVRIGVFGNCFYAVWRCRFGDPAMLIGLAKRHDEYENLLIFRDDCAELFFAVRKPYTEYFHVISNIRGALYDAVTSFNPKNGRFKSRPKEWDSGVTAMGRLEGGVMTIEMEVPLAALRLNEKDDMSVKLAFARSVRHRPSSKIAGGKYHNPPLWITCRLPYPSSRYPLSCISRKYSLSLLDNTAEYTVKNISGKDISGDFVHEVNGKPERCGFSIPAGKTKKFRFMNDLEDNKAVKRIFSLNAGPVEMIHECHCISPRELVRVYPLSDVLLKGESGILCLDPNPDQPTKNLSFDYRIGRGKYSEKQKLSAKNVNLKLDFSGQSGEIPVELRIFHSGKIEPVRTYHVLYRTFQPEL